MQLPVAHSVMSPQVCPLAFLQLPDPSHTSVPVQALGAVLSGIPLAMFPHVPLAPTAHDWQAGQLATPQQTLSTQVPVKHSEVIAQVCPLSFLQLPAPSHVLVPMHMLGAAVSGIPFAMSPHVPLLLSAHDWHAGQLATPQQTPSTQVPVKHSEVAKQVCPSIFLQLPAPSHELTPMHVLGVMLSGPAGMFPHVPLRPTAHDLHAGQLVTPQQTPSTQVPVKHSSVVAHARPLLFLQLPIPSHELVPMQVLGVTLSGPAGTFPQVPFPPSAHD